MPAPRPETPAKGQPLNPRLHFIVDDERWRAIEAATDRPAEVRPELVKLFERPRPE